jgi:hypothetical protein
MADKIQCQACGRKYKRITQTHLDTCSPGMTLEEYRQVYGATSPGGLSSALVKQYAGPIAEKVVNAITDDKALMQDLASRVGQYLFSEQARGKILGAAMMILLERAGSYTKMMERLNMVDDELFSKARVEAGGPDGEPTDTLTLLQLARYANTKVRDAEDTLTRLVKSSIDDRKTQGVQIDLRQTFTGVHEKIVVPSSLDAKQREALRRLGERLISPSKSVGEVIAKAKRNDEEIEDAEYEAVEE